MRNSLNVLTVAIPVISLFQAAAGRPLLALLGVLSSIVLCAFGSRTGRSEESPQIRRSLRVAANLAFAAWASGNSFIYSFSCVIWVIPCIGLWLIVDDDKALRTSARWRVCRGVALAAAVSLPLARHSPAAAVAMATVVAICGLLSHIRLTEAEALESETRVKQLWIDAIMRDRALGFIEWREGKLHCSDALLSALGDTADQAWLVRGWDHIVHTDDVQLLIEHMRREFGALRLPTSVEEIEPIECRVVRAHHKEYVHVRITGLLESDSRGNAKRALLAVLDQSAAKLAELRVRSELRRLREQGRELHDRYEALRSGATQREDIDRITRHDLKTPASSIAAIPSMLRQRVRFKPEDDALLSMIEESAQRILHILDLHADIFRMEQGTYVFEPSCVDLDQLIRECVAAIRIHAESKQVRLRIDAGAERLAAAADSLLCKSILENLLLNAVEAAPDGTEVVVAMYSGRRVGVAIHNQGAVPIEIRDHFFEKYVTHGKRRGLGLGTYSARLMAKAQRGDIEMFTHEERGTTLTLKLDRYDFVPSREAQDSIPAPWLVFANTSRPAGQAVQVLLAEDDADSALIVASWMPSTFRIMRAVNGRAAVVSAQKWRPDLILMDLEMPIMGGLDAISLIRKAQTEGRSPRSIIVAMSANGDPHTRRTAQVAGSDLFLVKPVTKAKLTDLLDLCMGDGKELSHP